MVKLMTIDYWWGAFVAMTLSIFMQPTWLTLAGWTVFGLVCLYFKQRSKR